ncbi:tripartite ATP-independent transporter solute receptor, DctP family [Cohaesibacter marisflavi]|uniref:Tripartite ATP-independent transporter solute receptor, DctP family n=1 Tax=Cohaesibacter marisflavi TaxID=655353 RepID=A0A1I5F211_9HYPH|nr:sialic acid TRAP transporter substrate-binding protein SiaP [Cohaesibacter marisflavi]SFO17646.1 tripartite ATP-independent transporter solute receptor, DctP family [Cohaesibacter marisflavi]
MKPSIFSPASLVAAAAMTLCVSATMPANAADVTIRWGDVVGGSHPQVMMIDKVADIVSKKSDGRIEIQSFPGGQLGGSRDMIEAVSSGVQHIVTEGAANFGQWVPWISVVEAPFIWKTPEQMISVLNGEMLDEINAQLAPAGMHAISALYYGTRHLTTSDKEIKTVADMEGFKIRVPQNDVFVAMAKAWGAKPTPINFNELYLALQQGLVDGQENPLPTIKSGKLNEVQKYIILTGHIRTPRMVVVNNDFWMGLSEEDRTIITDAVKEASTWANEEIMKQEDSLISEFKAGGVTVIEPDVESFRKATVDAVPPLFTEVWGEGTYEKLQNME